MLIIADIINTIIQSSMFILFPTFCTANSNKISRLKLLLFVFLLVGSNVITTAVLGNTSMGIFITHLLLMLVIIIVFTEDSLGAIITTSIIYLAIFINLVVMSTIFTKYIQVKIPEEYIEIGYICVLYVPQYIMSICLLLKRDMVYKLYLFIRSKRISIITIIITTVICDFIMSFNIIENDMDNPFFKPVIYILLGMFILGIIIYITRIEIKAKEIALLNKELEEKLNELKKIKHDYGAQISYLYGMHLMGKYDRLGGSLKEIINGYNDITSEIKVMNKESLISMVVNSIEHKGIKIIVSEEALLENISTTEMQLQRILYNILKNSVTALKGKGTIRVSTYYNFNYIDIKIENDGPQIPPQIIDKIFQEGFTTKKNKKSESGFGLAIVKEMLDKCGGKVEVASNNKSTYFKVRIPMLNNKNIN